MSNSPTGESNNPNNSLISTWLHSFFDLIYPVNCRACFRKLDSESLRTGYICEHCWNTIEYIRLPYCLRCGHPSGDGFSETCDECKSIKDISFLNSRGIAKYNGILRKAIHFWKYEYKNELVKPLQNIIDSYIQRTGDIFPADIIIPVPLHPIRLREREFNQAEILAVPVAQFLKIPLLSELLVRTRYTRPQMELSAEERWENVQGLFAVTNLDMIKNKKILIIDDVMTTGATVNECSKILMKNGALAVQVLVLARGN